MSKEELSYVNIIKIFMFYVYLIGYNFLILFYFQQKKTFSEGKIPSKGDVNENGMFGGSSSWWC